MPAKETGVFELNSQPQPRENRSVLRRDGEVEVFDLTGHPKAKRAYGWSHPENADGTGERFVAVLEIPPVDSPATAVKIAIYSDIKKGKVIPS